MKKPSEMQRGDMFLQLPNPLIGTEAKVFVKLEDAEGYTIFINNNALVKVCIGNYEPSFLDQWGISDGFYERMVESGEFVPISDIREVENYCPGFTIDL